MNKLKCKKHPKHPYKIKGAPLPHPVLVETYATVESIPAIDLYHLSVNFAHENQSLDQKRYPVNTKAGIINVSHLIVNAVLTAIVDLNKGKISKDISIAKIAEKARCSASRVKLAIKVLKEKGLVFVTHNYKKNENNQSRRVASTIKLQAFSKWIIKQTDNVLKSNNFYQADSLRVAPTPELSIYNKYPKECTLLRRTFNQIAGMIGKFRKQRVVDLETGELIWV